MKGLLPFGTAEQRARYLPRLASGELIAAFCLTEPGAGSDAASVRTTARRQSDGRWRLDGEKFWITNGGIADLYTVFARTDEDGGKMSAFIVEAAWAGVTHGTHEDKMGIRASSTTTVSFTDVQVRPIHCRFRPGAPKTRANGRRLLRGRKHRVDGGPLCRFRRRGLLGRGRDEQGVRQRRHDRATYEALQIAGGAAFMRENGYEQAARDARTLPIFEAPTRSCGCMSPCPA